MLFKAKKAKRSNLSTVINNSLAHPQFLHTPYTPQHQEETLTPHERRW